MLLTVMYAFRKERISKMNLLHFSICLPSFDPFFILSKQILDCEWQEHAMTVHCRLCTTISLIHFSFYSVHAFSCLHRKTPIPKTVTFRSLKERKGLTSPYIRKRDYIIQAFIYNCFIYFICSC